MSQSMALRPGFVKAAQAAPYLEREDEKTLALLWREQRDAQALHRIAHAHMRLVMAIAARFRHYGLPQADLVQEGHVGLLEAAARFEPDRDIRFSTYATWWIRAAIQDYVLRNWSIVRGGTSSNQKALFFNLRRLRARLARHGDHPPSSTFSQIALALGVSYQDVEMMNARLSGGDVSLNAPLAPSDSGEPDERGDFLVDTQPLPEDSVQEMIDSDRRAAWLKQALATLNPREFHIIQQRKLTDEAMTLEALADQLGISKERVRQLETRALNKLKSALLQNQPEAFLPHLAGSQLRLSA
jgi:RNA polymerase sigma-32 factor